MLAEIIYKRLYKLIPDLDSIEEYRALEADQCMKLGVDILHKDDKGIVVALSHYYKHSSGDLIPDPDMTLYISKREKRVYALTYQDMYRYDEVYSDCDTFSGELLHSNFFIKQSLNAFLGQWLLNLIEQGHK